MSERRNGQVGPTLSSAWTSGGRLLVDDELQDGWARRSRPKLVGVLRTWSLEDSSLFDVKRRAAMRSLLPFLLILFLWGWSKPARFNSLLCVGEKSGESSAEVFFVRLTRYLSDHLSNYCFTNDDSH